MKKPKKSMNGAGNALTNAHSPRNMPAVRVIPKNWRLLPFWQLNFAMWCIFALLFFVRLRLHLAFWPSLGVSIFQLAVCLLLTASLQISYRKLEKRVGFGVETAAWIIGLSLVATIIHSTAAHAMILLTGWRDPTWSLLDLWLLRMMFFWLVYMAWSLLYFWLRAEQTAQIHGQRASAAEAEAQRLELQLLRSQLDPHFLFNTLNGIATVISSAPATAITMVHELADYLRYSLDHRHDMVVSLETEIDALDAFIKIEQARFGEQLRIRSEMSPAARSRMVPCFLLQPLVENAIKHSLLTSEPPWELSVQAEVTGEKLHIEIHNTGTLSDRKSGGHGVGLENLSRRLTLHYPARHHFQLHQHGSFVCADLTLEGEPCSA